MLLEPVRVNGVEITNGAIAAESQNHPSATPQDAQKAALRALIVRELLLQEARRLKLKPEPKKDAENRVETSEEALIRQLLDKMIQVPDARESECLRYYEKNLERFRSPDRYQPRHILLSADPDDETLYSAAVDKAEALLLDLQKSPEMFDEIARWHSDCKSKAEGGRLGTVTSGQTTPQIEECLAALDNGQIHPQPIKAPYGVHVLQLISKVSGQTLPFEAVQDKIALYLQDASWRQAVTQYIEMLWGEAEIDGITYADLVEE